MNPPDDHKLETTPAPAVENPDPITGEPDAHPVGVGVGALGGAAAGAAIGAFGGPIGVAVGAAIGAVAGGLAGKEVASSSDTVAEDNAPVSLNEPLPTASSGLITPSESSFFADSTTGESSILVESPVPAAFAVTAEPDGLPAEERPVFESHLDTEHTIRTSAYYRYLGREASGVPGDALGDWVAAEEDVLRHE